MDGQYIERHLSSKEKKHADSLKARKKAENVLNMLAVSDGIECPSFPDVVVKRKFSDSSHISQCSENSSASQRKHKIAKNVAKNSMRDDASYKMNMKEKFDYATSSSRTSSSASCSVA